MRWLLLLPPLLLAVGALACAAPPPPQSPHPLPAEPTRTAASFPTEFPSLPRPVPDPSPALLRDARLALSAFANRAPAWSRDGRTLLFLSSREGHPAAWASSWLALDLPPTRLDPDNLVADATAFLPDNASALVLAHPLDRDAALLLRASLSGDLPQPIARLGGLLPRDLRVASGDRSTGALLAWDRAARSSTLFVLHPLDAPPRRVTNLSGAWMLLDVSPSGSHALVAPSPMPSTVTEIDLSNGSASELQTPASLQVADAAYGPDREQLWMAGTAFGRGCLVRARPARRAPAPYCIDGSLAIRTVRPSSDASRWALAVDWPDRSEVRFIGGAALSHVTVARLPPGTGDLVGFSPSGKAATVAWETPSSPPDMFEIDAQHGSVRRLRADVRPTLALFDSMESRSVQLESAGELSPVVVHAPASAWIGRTRNHPVVVLIHTAPERPALHWDPLVRLLVARGFVVVQPLDGFASQEPSTRTAPDAALLQSWLGMQPWADAARMGVVQLSSSELTAFAMHRNAPDVWDAAVELRTAPWEPSDDDVAPGSTDDARDDRRAHGSAELEVGADAQDGSVSPAMKLARIVAFLEHGLGVPPAGHGF